MAANPIAFDALLTAYPGKTISLQVTDGESTVTVTGETVQPAQNKALDETSARRSLEKTGGTPFVLNQLTVKTAGAFVPASALNALRRDALEQLALARIAAQPRVVSSKAYFEAPRREKSEPRLIVKTGIVEEIPDLCKAGADEILFQPQDFREEKLLPFLNSWPENTRLCLPSQLSEKTLEYLKQITEEKQIPVCLSSPGQLQAFATGSMAGEGIPVMNGETIKMLSHLGCESVTLSRELSKQDIQDLPTDGCELILPVYGRTRLMLLNHCPMRTVMGLKQDREQCELCGQGKGALGTHLTDRMKADYPLSPLRLPDGCQIELMADRPLHLSGLLKGLPKLSFLLAFTNETTAERLKTTAHYAALLRGETPPALDMKGTAGRFLEGVL